MKKLFYKYFFLAIFIGFSSCTTYEPPAYSGPEFLNFDKQQVNVKEEAGPAKIRVNIGGKLNFQPVIVKYSVTQNDNAVALFSIKNQGSLTIPGNQGYGDIEITPVDNSTPDGQKIVTLKITSVTGGNYVIGFPGPEGLNSSIDIYIIDDDCPLDRSEITGPVVETSSTIDDNGVLGTPSYSTVTISEDSEDSKGIIISDFFGISGALVNIHIESCTGDVSITSSDVTIPTTSGPVKAILNLPAGKTTPGTFDSQSGLLQLELSVDAEGGGTFGDYKFIYKK